MEEYSVSESEYEDPNNSKTKLWKSLMEKTATPMTINFWKWNPANCKKIRLSIQPKKNVAEQKQGIKCVIEF